MRRDDSLCRSTYLAFAPLALLSAIFGPLLYFFPDRTDTLFAWTIVPAMSAVCATLLLIRFTTAPVLGPSRRTQSCVRQHRNPTPYC